MCWELGVNSSADPCPLATKPLPVLLLLCFPRMPAGLGGSRTAGSSALTFPIIRKRCFLASCKVCSGIAGGNDSGGALAAPSAPRGIPCLGQECHADPWPCSSLDPSFGKENLSSDVEPDLFSQHDPAACRNLLQWQTGTGHQETLLQMEKQLGSMSLCLVLDVNAEVSQQDWCQKEQSEPRKGCDSWEPLAWFPEQAPCVLKDRGVWKSLTTNISPGHNISCIFPTPLCCGVPEVDHAAITGDNVLFPLSPSQIFPGKRGTWC
nr:uncharacterized protein LOC115495434 [Taeniopygia guttata]